MRTTREAVAQFPSGWLVVLLLASSGVLWAVLFFVTLPRLELLASGAPPFDIRPFGYGVEEAKAYLDALGDAGRAYYLNPELVLDGFFPPLYAASRVLALWWLTMPGRLRDGAIAPGWRRVLVALPVLELILDWGENTGIATMLWSWPDLSAAVVGATSAATRLKLLTAACTEISLLVLAAIALLRWLGRRRRVSA